MFEVGAERSSPGVDEGRLPVGDREADKTAAIEADATEDRDGAATDTAAPAGGGDGDAGFVAAAQHLCDLGRVGRSSDDRGSRGHRTRQRPPQ